MSSLPKANWNGQTGRGAGTSIGMHAHPKIGFMIIPLGLPTTCGARSSLFPTQSSCKAMGCGQNATYFQRVRTPPKVGAVLLTKLGPGKR